MYGWRSDIAVMREMITGTSSEGWRNDLIAVARMFGYNSKGWRGALRDIALYHGAAPSGWKNDIIGISMQLGKPEREGWRKSLLFIKEYYRTNPPNPPSSAFFLNIPPREPNTRYLVLAEGLISSDKIIMA